MKKYIFLTRDIHIVGGMQSYTAEKTQYLSKKEFEVEIIFSGNNKGKCGFSQLNKYVKNGIIELSMPPFKWPDLIISKVIKKVLKIIGNVEKYDSIIIESQDDTTSQWGELIASKINGKHFCMICNEKFRGENKYYEDKIDYYVFKYNRKEIAGIRENSLQNLFNGYKNINEDESYSFICAELPAIQNVYDKRIEQLKKSDYTIAYVGRTSKAYFDNILNGIKKFSEKFYDKSIQFIIVGDTEKKDKVIRKKLSNGKNINLIFMGNMVPIPKELITKIDVVIAGAGCANECARADVYTLVADAQNYLCNGLLGYETYNALYHEDDCIQTEFDEALEKVLINKLYDEKECILTPVKNSSFYYDKYMQFLNESLNSETIYYDTNKLIYDKKINYFKILKLYLNYKFPQIANILRKLKKGVSIGYGK